MVVEFLESAIPSQRMIPLVDGGALIASTRVGKQRTSRCKRDLEKVHFFPSV